MKITERAFFAVLVAAFFCFGGARRTFGASMNLISPGSSVTGTNVLNNVYVGAYTALINGVSTPVVCDDYGDESYIPESWTANSTSLASSSLAATMWNSATGYEEAAWLIEQMVKPANASQIGDIQYTIWGIFNSTAVSDLKSYSLSNNTLDYFNALDPANPNSWLNQAKNDYTSVDLADFTIYTPVSSPPPTCSGSPCPSAPPQEFMTYSASESSFFGILGADLLLFGCAVVVLRRRRILEAVR